MSHCKGPWAYVPIREGRGFYIHANGYAIAQMMNDGDLETCEANARLIAAAAEMLEALKQIARGEGYYGAQAREYKEIAALAIQKAEGA